MARLHVGTGFLDTLKRDIEGNFTVSYHLAPPLLPTKRDARGRPRKISLGGWLRLPFRWLARMKRLRVTAFDRFGCTAERRAERALIGWYEDLTALLLRSQLRRWTSAATAR